MDVCPPVGSRRRRRCRRPSTLEACLPGNVRYCPNTCYIWRWLKNTAVHSRVGDRMLSRRNWRWRCVEKPRSEFKPLFNVVHTSLRARNAASGGEEMLRLRVYEKAPEHGQPRHGQQGHEPGGQGIPGPGFPGFGAPAGPPHAGSGGSGGGTARCHPSRRRWWYEDGSLCLRHLRGAQTAGPLSSSTGVPGAPGRRKRKCGPCGSSRLSVLNAGAFLSCSR